MNTSNISAQEKYIERYIWRAGWHRQAFAVKRLLGWLEEADNAERQYALAWALGRCGSAEAIDALRTLRLEPSTQAHVKRMAFEAERMLCDTDEAREVFLTSVRDALPGSLREAKDAESFAKALRASVKRKGPSETDLHPLYLLDTPEVRPALLGVLAEVPLGSAWMQHIRAIFKAAEYRGDGEVFGLLNRRFEATLGSGDPEATHMDEWAWSIGTRIYMRRRGWRTMERAAKAEDWDLFMGLATGVLLAFDAESSAQAPELIIDGIRYRSDDRILKPFDPKAVKLGVIDGSGDSGNPFVILGEQEIEVKKPGKGKYYTYTAPFSGNYRFQAKSKPGTYGYAPSFTVKNDSNRNLGTAGTGYYYRRKASVNIRLDRGQTVTIVIKKGSYSYGSSDYVFQIAPTTGDPRIPKHMWFASGNYAYTVLDDAFVFHHILYGLALDRHQPGSHNFRKRVQSIVEGHHTGNKTPYREQWIAHPAHLLELLSHSDNDRVLDFALELLQQNEEFCATLELQQLAQLLGKAHQDVQAFAIGYISTKDLSALPEETEAAIKEAIPNLLESPALESRQIALRWIQERASDYIKSSRFVVSMSMSPYADLRQGILQMLLHNPLTDKQQQKCFDALFAALEKEPTAPVTKEAKTTLMEMFPEAFAKLDLPLVQRFLDSPVEALQGIGLQLLQRLDDDTLLAEPTLLRALMTHERLELQYAVRPLLKHLCDLKPELGDSLANQVLQEFTSPTFGGGPYNIHFSPPSGQEKTASLRDYTLERRRQALPDNDGGLLTLEHPQVLVGPNIDDKTSTKVPVGFSFHFGGRRFKNFTADSNGWILFNGSWGYSSYSNYNAWQMSKANGLFPWWADLKTSWDGYVRTEVLNKSPNRIRVIEWRCWSASGYSQDNHITVQFQCCLYEGSNRIEYRYGPIERAGSPYDPPTTACGAAVDTTEELEGNVRDFFGSYGDPPGSAGPYRGDLYTSGASVHYPGANNVGILGTDTDLSSLEARYTEMTNTLLAVFPTQLERLSLDQVQILLAHPLTPVQQLGAQILYIHRARPNEYPQSLLTLLLRSQHASIRGIGFDLLDQLTDAELFERKELFLELATDPSKDVQARLEPMAERLAATYNSFGIELLKRLLAIPSKAYLKVMRALRKVIKDEELLSEEGLLDTMVTHPSHEVRRAFYALAKKLAQKSPEDALSLGFRMLRAAKAGKEMEQDAPDPVLFEKHLLPHLPDETLADQPALLFKLCRHVWPALSALGQEHLKRLTETFPRRVSEFVRGLVGELLRRERHDQDHTQVRKVLDEVFGGPMGDIPANLRWRLVFASSTIAQDLGIELLQKADSADFSLKKLAQLASHELHDVRARSWEMLRESVPRMKQDMEGALRVLDADWEDSRDFAFELYRESFGPEELTAPILVSICDSTRPDVQRFGRELITRYFGPEDGPEYLEKLSQHPADNVELFVTNYLERFGAGDAERIASLEPYFLRVLCRVNRGRVAKDRILHFLQNEARKDEAIAEVSAKIFAWVSATASVGDRAFLIDAMLDLHEQYPQLALPLTQKPVEARTGGRAHAV